MDAANPKRAALRLALCVGGVTLTVAMVVATVVLAGAEPGEADAPAAETTTVSLTPPHASFELPDDLDAEIVGPTISPLPRLTLRSPERLAPVEFPAYSAPIAEPTPSPDTRGEEGQGGPLTIHNPAAFGPPEDDSIPSLPGSSPHVARSPEATTPPEGRAEDALAEGPRWAGPDAPPRVARFEPPVAAQPAFAAPPRFAAPSVPDAPAESEDPPSVPDPSRGGLRTASAERSLRDLAPPDAEAIECYTASTTDLSRRLTRDVQDGFQLGKSGAVFAARAKFVEVLRRIAMAKDAASGDTSHSDALADGLRMLDAADDFVPTGDALESELDVDQIASSHGVRLASDGRTVAPHEAIARYSQHAAGRLADAVAGEQAGSMALYGLGKSYDRLEAQGGDATAGRKSAVMYRAAVDAHPENYLAANELGVRLAKVGRYEQARRVLRRAASQPTAVAAVHANLAAVERRLGHSQSATLAHRQGEEVAARERLAGEVSRRHGIEWVDPSAFRRAAIDPALAPPAPSAPAAYAAERSPAPYRTAGRAQVAPLVGPPSLPPQRVVR